jgi:hypothetical protein
MCEIDHDDDGLCALWRESWVKARKPRACGSCQATIAPGDRYLKHFSIHDGDAHRASVCQPCGEAHKAFFEAHDVHLAPPDSVAYELNECINNSDADDDPARWQAMLDALKARREAARPRKESA